MASRIDASALALLLALAACNRAAPPAGSAAADSANPIQVVDPVLFAACDSLEQWTRASGAAEVQRTNGQFTGAARLVPRWGCHLIAVHARTADSLSDSVTSDSITGESLPGISMSEPVQVLRARLADHGWTAEQDFSAESSDGVMFGMRTGTLVCVLQQYWTAHSDDDRAAQPADRSTNQLELECFRDAPRAAR